MGPEDHRFIVAQFMRQRTGRARHRPSRYAERPKLGSGGASPSRKRLWALKILMSSVVATFSLLHPTTLLGCPSCKEHLAANGLDTGYAISILIMILVPLTVIATWTVLILRLRSSPQPEFGNELDAV